MTKNRRQATKTSLGSRKKEEVSKKKAVTDTSENCRCKEVAKKTPREMLGLMISDFAFWKKAKGNK